MLDRVAQIADVLEHHEWHGEVVERCEEGSHIVILRKRQDLASRCEEEAQIDERCGQGHEQHGVLEVRVGDHEGSTDREIECAHAPVAGDEPREHAPELEEREKDHEQKDGMIALFRLSPGEIRRRGQREKTDQAEGLWPQWRYRIHDGERREDRQHAGERSDTCETHRRRGLRHCALHQRSSLSHVTASARDSDCGSAGQHISFRQGR